ncbi:hypothetical protein GcM3_134002 [Golovinomyces cichoracearum]|uniref:Uncharacterized protein n=1 Tax=Golovinomyces cichoracearum TaxID=62708 RepID=A0A420I3G8_9PEZI|nr:hypothetical protein GcM3_134002 [Golovinomyces cichoracearum]
MGICFSCLGGDPDRDFSDDDEQSRLLFEDSLDAQYGTFRGHDPRSIYADPVEAQRANEALMKVVSKTSDNLVDIFAVIPQNTDPSSAASFPYQDSCPQHYEDIISKISFDDRGEVLVENSSLNPLPLFDVCSTDKENQQKLKSHHSIKFEGIGPFLGEFVDPTLATEERST